MRQPRFNVGILGDVVPCCSLAPEKEMASNLKVAFVRGILIFSSELTRMIISLE